MEQFTAAEKERHYQYPEGAQVYGVVVDERLASPVINVGLEALHQKKVDRVVFLCLAPHDIRSRTDWDDILAHLPLAGDRQRQYDVRIVQTPDELLYASMNMRVIRLPDDTVVI